MKPSDFKDRKVKYFTQEEIEATGADLADVQLNTVLMLDCFRHTIKKPVNLLKNGLTTGEHSSKYHPQGKAADIWISDLRTEDRPVELALNVGFRGIGVYRNQSGAYSFHLDTRPFFWFWQGVKVRELDSWAYSKVFIFD